MQWTVNKESKNTRLHGSLRLERSNGFRSSGAHKADKWIFDRNIILGSEGLCQPRGELQLRSDPWEDKSARSSPACVLEVPGMLLHWRGTCTPRGCLCSGRAPGLHPWSAWPQLLSCPKYVLVLTRCPRAAWNDLKPVPRGRKRCFSLPSSPC